MRLCNTWNIVKAGLMSIFLMLSCGAFAQTATVSQARQYAADKNYSKAIDVYKEIYGIAPDSVYSEYLRILIADKQYKPAEKLVQKEMANNKQDAFLHIDMGNVYLKEKKVKKAAEEFDIVLNLINGDDVVTQQIVNAFTGAGDTDYAITTYEKATMLLHNPIYSIPLAKLYAATGNTEKAIDMLLAGTQQNSNTENIKATLLELLGDDQKKLKEAQSALIKKINEEPGSVYYAELLTWIYTQKNDWDGALMQIEAIDERYKEDGKRLLDLARFANSSKQYDAAEKAYDDVIAKGPASKNYAIARSEELVPALAQLRNTPDYKPEQVNKLLKLYDTLLIEFPRFYSTPTAADYAMVAALYANDVQRGIDILQKAIDYPDTRPNMVGIFKLQLGDYYVLQGKIWDASLYYSQVDKAFKNDALGEEARFRNAKLAYYRGDFTWAQEQLSVLKASTSELIANDALYLSVLITENVEDSSFIPLQRYAYADLLLFQNKDKEAETLLDSINKAFPKHPLNDDIIMQRAKIALKHHEFDKAIAYLKTIYEQYGQDVLGDDAVFMIAEIYHDDMHQADQAKHYYEQLIIDYPGSTYVQTARQRLNELNTSATP